MTLEVGDLFVFLAIVLSIAVIATIAAVTAVSPALTDQGYYTTGQHTAYILCCTVAATLITSLITSSIRNLWVRYVDVRLAKSRGSHTQINEINSQWRTALSLASIAESLGHHRWVFLSYLITALTTTSILTALAPTPGTKSIDTAIRIPNGDATFCAKPIEVGADYTYGTDTNYWNMSSDPPKIFWVDDVAGECPMQFAVPLLGDINTEHPDQYAYEDRGIKVHSSAVGASIALYAFDGLFESDVSILLADYGNNLLNVGQCAPVIIRNPFVCRRGGIVNVAANQTDKMTVTSDDGTCTIGQTQEVYTIEPGVESGYCLNGAVGQGTLLLGASNYYANVLSIAVGDDPGPESFREPYSVECTIDATSVFDWRWIELSLQNVSQNGYDKILFSEALPDSPCYPEWTSDQGWNVSAAIVATALSQLVGYQSGFDFLSKFICNGDCSQPRTAPWAFEESENALEDVLGLISAMVLSRNTYNATQWYVYGTAEVKVTRMGSGRLYGLFLVIPPLIATIILLSLAIVTSKYRHRQKVIPVKTSDMKGMLRWSDESWHTNEEEYGEPSYHLI